jgi:hypothetical protein
MAASAFLAKLGLVVGVSTAAAGSLGTLTGGSIFTPGGAAIQGNALVQGSIESAVDIKGSYFRAQSAYSWQGVPAETYTDYQTDHLDHNNNPPNYSYEIRVGGVAGISIDNAQVVSLPGTADATNTTSGALQVSGGASIATNLWVGGELVPLGGQTHDSVVVIGLRAGTVDGTEEDCVIIGRNAYADNSYSTVIGADAFADGGGDSVVVGDYSFVNGVDGISIGSYCLVGDDGRSERSIHIGADAIRGNHDDSNGIGYGSYLYGNRTQAFGNFQRNGFTEALASDQILLGHGAAWSGANTMQIGGSRCQLEVTGKTGDFTDGEVITGVTSGATARAVDNAVDDTLNVAMTSAANFQVGETITGSSSGHTATLTTVNYADYVSNINTVRFNRGVETISFANPLSFIEEVGFSSTASSTNTTTGAIVVTGGVGIGENLNVGGAITQDGAALAVQGVQQYSNVSSYFEDFNGIDSGHWVQSIANGGTWGNTSSSLGEEFGVLRVGSGTTAVANARGAASTGTPSSAGGVRVGVGEYTFGIGCTPGNVTFDGVLTGTIWVGLASSIAPTSGFNTILFRSTDGGNWFAVTGNGTETATDTGVAAAANTYHNLKFVVSSDGTEVNFYIDGVLVATHTTNIPTTAMTHIISVNRSSATGTDVAIRVDYVMWEMKFDADRF